MAATQRCEPPLKFSLAKLLITGATGLLGSCIARESLSEHDVFGISRSTAPAIPYWHHRCFDLTDATAMLPFLRRCRPEIIVHCAARTDVELCEKDASRAWAINVDSTKTLATWASEHDAKFVCVSTDSVFDGTRGNYRESDEPAPVNVYARTKLAAEDAVRSRCPNALIVRTNFFGWSRGRSAGLAEWMLTRLINGERFGGFTDVRFDPLFTEGLAHIILELIRHDARGVFHAGTQDSCSKYEFAIALANVFRLDASLIHPISVDKSPLVARRPKNTSLATEKISAFLGREMPSVSKQVHALRSAMPLGNYLAGDAGADKLVRPNAAM